MRKQKTKQKWNKRKEKNSKEIIRSFLAREHNEIVLKIVKQMVELRHKNN